MASKKTSKPTSKQAPATSKTGATDTPPRRLTPASFGKRRLRRRAEKQVARTPLPSAFRIMASAVRMLRDHWEVFGGILLMYVILDIILVGGLSGTGDLQTFKTSLDGLFSGNFSQVTTGFTLFAFLVAQGTGVASGVASAYQTVLLIIVSLSMVWALRQFYAGHHIRIRDALYNSSYPLVQLLLVLLMLSLHLVPAVLGSYLFSTLVINGIIVVAWQQALIGAGCFLLLVWTFYLLCHSLIAAYIVTLPGVTPLSALRSAKEVVRYRRAAVLRKLLFLPLAIVVVFGVIMIPVAALAAPVVVAVYFLLSILGIPIIHAYMYTLYRDLIQ